MGIINFKVTNIALHIQQVKHRVTWSGWFTVDLYCRFVLTTDLLTEMLSTILQQMLLKRSLMINNKITLTRFEYCVCT